MKLELKPFNIRSNIKIAYLLLNPKTKKDFSYSTPQYLFTKFSEIIKKNKRYRFEILIDGKLSGFIGLVKTKKINGYEMGYLVLEKFRNKNIASESISKIIAFASKLRLKRIYAITDINNPSSIKVLEKNKFKKFKVDNKNREVMWSKEIK
jgi:RimJ/RimL family protein N-acetyltransferase